MSVQWNIQLAVPANFHDILRQVCKKKHNYEWLIGRIIDGLEAYPSDVRLFNLIILIHAVTFKIDFVFDFLCDASSGKYRQ